MKRKFKNGDRCIVNKKAVGDSYFVGKIGRIMGYYNTTYEIDFLIPGNYGIETRKIKAYKLNKIK